MKYPFERIEFWERAAQEDDGEWRRRILDDGILFEIEYDPTADLPGVKALNGFLSDADTGVRLKALRALTCLGNAMDLCGELSTKLTLSLLEDSCPEVRFEATRCCRVGKVSESVPVLLRLLANDDHLRREFYDSEAGKRPPLARETFQALEDFDVVEAVPLLETLGVHSRWLSRHTTMETSADRSSSFVGRYVSAEEAAGEEQTSLFPAQNLNENPLCPACTQPTRIIAIVKEPFGPPGAGPIPFYRCLSCTCHTHLIVAFGPPAECLEKPGADCQSGFRGPNPGQLPWTLQWTPRTPDSEVGTYTPLLGGQTDWVQYDETPTCPRCAEKMDFVIKLPGEAGQFPLVEFQGVLYGHWCGRCRVTATHFQT